jgi:hypothetical protein
MNAFISYDRLRSSDTVHQISATPPTLLYSRITEFIETFTDAATFESASLILPPMKIFAALAPVRIFGLPKINFYKSLGVNASRIYYTVDSRKIKNALQFLDENSHAILAIQWKFKFVDVVSRQPLPDQELIPIMDERISNSQLYVRFSQSKSTVSPWFAFPFSELNDTNRHYIDKIINSPIFNFSEKSWRKWQLTKNGKWIPRKLHDG